MTQQNTSPAVMAQRADRTDSLDDFPTPPWATRALCEWLEITWPDHRSCREPSANRGYMAETLREYFDSIEASDIHDYGAGYLVQDYLTGPDPEPVDWTITNPPFTKAEEFIARAIKTSRIGVAVFVRASFTEGQSRYERLFKANPPSHILHFSERVGLYKGRLLNPNRKYAHPVTGKMRKPSTATAYCWMVWMPTAWPTITEWIPPGSRKRLERPDDYETREDNT
jgi:hypothetical protein